MGALRTSWWLAVMSCKFRATFKAAAHLRLGQLQGIQTAGWLLLYQGHAKASLVQAVAPVCLAAFRPARMCTWLRRPLAPSPCRPPLQPHHCGHHRLSSVGCHDRPVQRDAEPAAGGPGDHDCDASASRILLVHGALHVPGSGYGQ